MVRLKSLLRWWNRLEFSFQPDYLKCSVEKNLKANCWRLQLYIRHKTELHNSLSLCRTANAICDNCLDLILIPFLSIKVCSTRQVVPQVVGQDDKCRTFSRTTWNTFFSLIIDPRNCLLWKIEHTLADALCPIDLRFCFLVIYHLQAHVALSPWNINFLSIFISYALFTEWTNWP